MKIALIGSGNVANVLAQEFTGNGHHIITICSRNKITGNKLARKYQAAYFSEIKSISDDADIYIIATGDSGINQAVSEFPFVTKPVVHTSGATNVKELERFKSYGVFYPLNTITAGKPIPKDTWICIEANSSKLNRELKQLAHSIHCKSIIQSSEKRLATHLAAVIANNFVNSLYQVAFDILKSEGISMKILHPLMQTTLDNALSSEPKKAQTGPAKRKDFTTIKKHLHYLRNNKETKSLYQKINNLIIAQSNSTSE